METAQKIVLDTRPSRIKRALGAMRTLPLLPSTVLAMVLFSAIVGVQITPWDPLKNNMMDALTQPFGDEKGNWAHLLGTDHLGRDTFSRIIYGSRISLLVAFAAIGLSGSFGTLLGMLSGYLGGKVDAVIMRATDAMLSMPSILIAIAIVGALGTSLNNVVFVIALVTWASYARLIRGETLRIKESDFVRLAVVAGLGPLKIVFVHILPNVVNTLIVLSTLQIGQVIVYESSLSFLGLGVPIGTPSWGSMLADGRQYLTSAWWLATFPGLAIMFTCLGCNLMGDWLRDRLDPRRQRQ